MSGASGAPISDSALHFSARERPLELNLGPSAGSVVADRKHLVGYLCRRYGYSGAYLEITHVKSDSNTLCDFAESNSLQLPTILANREDEIEKNLKNCLTGSKYKYDVILVDLKYPYSHLISVVEDAMKCLSEGGTLLIAGCALLVASDAGSPEEGLGAWETAIALRMREDIDVAIGHFDRYVLK